eukprot:1601010-Lingulodinium_polyedra.AAC.1
MDMRGLTPTCSARRSKTGSRCVAFIFSALRAPCARPVWRTAWPPLYRAARLRARQEPSPSSRYSMERGWRVSV